MAFSLICLVFLRAATASGTQPTIAWTYKTGGTMKSDPTISPDGKSVFIGTDDTNVYAFQLETGALEWKFKTGGKVWACLLYTSPSPRD